MEVGEKIKVLMKQRGYSQNKLAKAAQISQSGLSTIINGGSSPSATTLSAIANALGCSVSELMGEETDHPPDQPRTPEAKLLAYGIDQMPKEQREQALKIFQTVFTQYADFFRKDDDDEGRS